MSDNGQLCRRRAAGTNLRMTVVLLVLSLIGCVLKPALAAPATQPSEERPYLSMVKAYADVMVDKGRDVYGPEHTPLFASMLSRKTHAIFNYPFETETRAIEGYPDVTIVGGWYRTKYKDMRHNNTLLKQGVNWGWNGDESMPDTANVGYDDYLLNTLYQLSGTTKDPRYAQAADDALRYFMSHCQDPRTGFFAWGEHMGWHLVAETWTVPSMIQRIHEFWEPWPLTERLFELDPTAMERFAIGQWRHQIGNHELGLWSRHGHPDTEPAGRTGHEYPRLVGQMGDFWSVAYTKSQDPQVKAEMVRAVNTVLDSSLRRRKPNGALPFGTREDVANSYNLNSNVIMLTYLPRIAERMADQPATQQKIQELMSSAIEVILVLKHDLQPGGKGYLAMAFADTLEGGNARDATKPMAGYGEFWGGKWTNATLARMLLEVASQQDNAKLKELGLAGAALYLERMPPTYDGKKEETILMPFVVADAIQLMVDAHEVTQDPRYLKQAQAFGHAARDLFFDDLSPLPKITSFPDDLHRETYLSATGGDDLIFALLRLDAATNP